MKQRRDTVIHPLRKAYTTYGSRAAGQMRPAEAFKLARKPQILLIWFVSLI